MVYAINGQIPGPEIIVTEGDMVGSQEGVISYHIFLNSTIHEITQLISCKRNLQFSLSNCMLAIYINAP